MKTINVIKALLTNAYDIEQMGLYTYEGVEDCKEFFGEGGFGSITCAMLPGTTFLYYYKTNDEDLKFAGKEPDAWYYAEDGSEIALFQIYDI